MSNGHLRRDPHSDSSQGPELPQHERQPLLEKGKMYPSDQAVALWDPDEESEAEREDACRGMTLIAVFLFTILMGLRYLTAGLTQHQFSNPSSTGTAMPTTKDITDASTRCPGALAFCEPANHRVSTKKEGFPSFWKYAFDGPMNVTYDKRSIMINGERALFLSGSMHPIRTTKETWEIALDEAVHNGLNMITIYVFWGEHQPFPDQDIDWTLPAGKGPDCALNPAPDYCGWSLADAIRSAASRGLFVHARIGPYVCAEYNYGGIPEWVALHNPGMAMRRYNREWLNAMEAYVKNTVEYFQSNNLFAYQGGPIIMAQIENELGEEDDSGDIPVMDDDMPPPSEEESSNRLLQAGTFQKNVTVQEYADWCGVLMDRLAPQVIITMCNGLSANNTILTCNGDCSTKWLEDYGTGNGRIQVDQPAIWTEDEGGFQLWGDDSSAPSDYFWGRTARAMAFDTLRWFARGGSHLNYYMWWGGYNRGRASAAGIMNGYATDAAVCPSGQPREPKFSHLKALHKALQHIAPILLNNPSALKRSIDVQQMKSDGGWEYTGKQRMFVYTKEHTVKGKTEVMIVENDSKNSSIVRIPLDHNEEAQAEIFHMNPLSAILLVDGVVKFDSFAIDVSAMAHKRIIALAPVDILGWSSCIEPIGASSDDSLTVARSKPEEQTALNIDARIYSDYAWYEMDLYLQDSVSDVHFFVESQIGSALVFFIDDNFVGEAYTQKHGEGNKTFEFYVDHVRPGPHKVAILSESLGYHNLIGRWGAKVSAKVKGITGDVILTSNGNDNMSLTDGRIWRSHPGLNGHENSYCRDVKGNSTDDFPRPMWTSAMFNTPDYDPTSHTFYLNITNGRGHVWLNGHDLGRFWNITRGETGKYSQQYYFLPPDFLEVNGSVNTLVFFDVLGSDLRLSTTLVLSWLKKTSVPYFKDRVDYPLACI